MATKPAKNAPAKRKAAGRSKAKPKAKSAAKPKAHKVTLDRKEPRGLFAHIWEARRGLRASFEAQISQGITEERLLAYVAFACFMAFLGGLPLALETARLSGMELSVPALVAGRFVAFVFFAPLFLYGLAAVSHLFSRWAFGGQGDYPTARMALFWALVLGVPLGLFQALILQALTLSGLGYLSVPVGILTFLIWLWIWASFLAIAEGFGRLKCYLFLLAGIACAGGLIKLIFG